MDLLVVVTDVACWGTVIAVWIATAIRDSRGRRSARISGSPDLKLALAAFVTVAVIIVVGRRLLASLAIDAAWVRMIGAVILVGSTVLAIWARRSLGRSWSIAPRAALEDGLRTAGPYAITRHPIYTGLLGMLIGSAVLGGLGQWLVLPVAAWVGIEVKIRSEERLLLAIFPDSYRAYRERVPRLIPGWRGGSSHRDPR